MARRGRPDSTSLTYRELLFAFAKGDTVAERVFGHTTRWSIYANGREDGRISRTFLPQYQRDPEFLANHLNQRKAFGSILSVL